MTTENLSSEEMISRAKESLRIAKEDMQPEVREGVAEFGMPLRDEMPADMGDSMPAGMSGEMVSRARADRTMANAEPARSPRSRRVPSSTEEHLVVTPRSVTIPSVPVPPSPFTSGSLAGSGRWMRILGNFLLGFVAVIWLLLLVGLIDNPDDLGETVGGGSAITLVPLLFGLVLRRAGKRRGIAV